MVDTLALGASLARGGGSSPLLGTMVKKRAKALFFVTIVTPGEDLKSGGGHPRRLFLKRRRVAESWQLYPEQGVLLSTNMIQEPLRTRV